MQENLIRSHAAGVGPALTPQKTRMLLALRINILAKGYSGISPKTLQQLIDAFNGKTLVIRVRECKRLVLKVVGLGTSAIQVKFIGGFLPSKYWRGFAQNNSD